VGQSISWVAFMSRGGASFAFDVFYNFEIVFLILFWKLYLEVKSEIGLAPYNCFQFLFSVFWFIPEHLLVKIKPSIERYLYQLNSSLFSTSPPY
jgi:hypothetical protein